METRIASDLLPLEIWSFVFGLGVLNKLDLKYISITCRLFNELINDKRPTLIKNASWPLSDYAQHVPEGNCVFFKAETEMVSFIQLKNGNFVCGLSNGKLQVLDENSAECKQTMDGHLDSMRTKFSALAQLSLLGISTSGYDKIKNPIRTIHEHSNGDIITGADDKIICVFDAKSGVCKRKLTGHTGYVMTIKELDNGNILTGSNHGDLRIWEIESGQCIRTLKGHDNGLTSMVVLKDGSVVSGGPDGSLCILNNVESDERVLVKGHNEAIRTMIVFDDKNVITGSNDNTIRVWDSETWKCKQKLQGHTGAIKALAILRDEYIVSGSDDKTIRVWNIKTGECKNILKGHTGSITALVRKGNGDVASISDDKTFHIWHFGYVDARQDASRSMIAANNMRL